jgi:hypothetical protein
MTTEERLALCEARVGALFSLLMAAYKVMLRKGLVADAELAETFNQISATLQRGALQAAELTDRQRLDIESHLAEIGRLRHHLAV